MCHQGSSWLLLPVAGIIASFIDKVAACKSPAHVPNDLVQSYVTAWQHAGEEMSSP